MEINFVSGVLFMYLLCKYEFVSQLYIYIYKKKYKGTGSSKQDSIVVFGTVIVNFVLYCIHSLGMNKDTKSMITDFEIFFCVC